MNVNIAGGLNNLMFSKPPTGAAKGSASLKEKEAKGAFEDVLGQNRANAEQDVLSQPSSGLPSSPSSLGSVPVTGRAPLASPNLGQPALVSRTASAASVEDGADNGVDNLTRRSCGTIFCVR
ncbi:MAG: hypothetical protein HC902_00230 [Calothrix sp. SM1_5_4]|nr:hypothetical protein [Calothrix sp. SM1_5_4]